VDLDCVARLLAPNRTSYSAAEVIDHLMGSTRSQSACDGYRVAS
jgi:hypothetical protein